MGDSHSSPGNFLADCNKMISGTMTLSGVSDLIELSESSWKIQAVKTMKTIREMV